MRCSSRLLQRCHGDWEAAQEDFRLGVKEMESAIDTAKRLDDIGEVYVKGDWGTCFCQYVKHNM